MRVHALVPVLAIIAMAPFITAAETIPVTLAVDGFIDSSLSGSMGQLATDTMGSHSSERIGFGSQFAASAKIGLGVAISETVKGQIDLQYTGNEQTETGDGSQFDLRQAYGFWQITPDLTFKSGKFISAIGWTAAYAPDWYRVNTGPIFNNVYGYDELGAGLIYYRGDPDHGAYSLEFDVTNGFFLPEGYNNRSRNNSVGTQEQGKNAYAYTLDATYYLPNQKGNIDLEGVLDVNGGLYDTGTPGEKRGNAFHVAINTTITPTDAWTLGAEALWQQLQAPNETSLVKEIHTSLLGVINYKLAGTPFPMSITGMVQHLEVQNAGGVEHINWNETEVCLALLTRPKSGDDHLRINVEVFYDLRTDTDDTTQTDTTTHTFGTAARIIYVFP